MFLVYWDDHYWEIMLMKAVIFDLGDTLVSQESGRAFPHAVEVLEELRGRYKLGLVTNTRLDMTVEGIREILREAEVPDVFDVIVVSGELGVSKPDPGIFGVALEGLGVEPGEAVMVGNMVSTDVFGGNRAGMKTVLFQPGGYEDGVVSAR
jgi:HAD superfamily hydrolase (TIGR01662 family)